MIRGVEVSATVELDDISGLAALYLIAKYLILECDPVTRRKSYPFGLELVALPQREEPDQAADDNNDDRVNDEDVVENDEADGDVVSLHDSSKGHQECETQRDPKHHSSYWEVRSG